MNFAIAYSRAQDGIAAPLVTVEVHLANGLPSLSIVGLPETAVKESKDRVRAALLNSHFEFPARRITINLAPADLPKEGSRFDLAIAMGVLAASGQLPADTLLNYEFVGELALSGELRPVRGVLPTAIHTSRSKRSLLLPADNANEASLITGANIFAARHLLEVCAHLRGKAPLPGVTTAVTPAPSGDEDLDLSDVRGQHYARRALEIAAAGGHNLLMIGPPGTGKTMLASRLPGILPDMSDEEALETAAILSISGNDALADNWRKRLFRAPHHTASAVALVGGGSQPRPGEISLAHNGVLFLDELPEFDRRVLEVLREPLESGTITISRAARQRDFPSRFQLIAAMNPCPCGYLGDNSGRCHCSSEQIRRYKCRISGPLLDRIDMHVEVPRCRDSSFSARGESRGESSAAIKQRVAASRNRQIQRCGKPNVALNNKEIEEVCRLSENDNRLLEKAVDTLRLSPRAYHRILKVARTIADLANADAITTAHLTEAISYRRLDRRLT